MTSDRRRSLLLVLVGAQVLYVLGVAAAGYATTALGQHIVLGTRPVDARELRYGDFVRLNYAIGEVPGGLWRGPGGAPPRRRQRVYVLLAAGPDSLSTALGVYASAPRPGAGQAVLGGWVEQVYGRSLRLRYGLERYYVPEGSALRRQKPGPAARPLRVHVSIAPWGQSRITAVR